MKPTRLNSECITCLLKKYLPNVPKGAAEDERLEYMQKILGIVADVPKTMSAPEIVNEIQQVQRQMFDNVENFSDVKRYFNSLMLSLEEELMGELKNAEDSLKLAVCYAMVGNYIDFGAMKNVDEQKLIELLEDAKNISVNEEEFCALKDEILKATKLIYLTDNCGEIVLDKLLISVIKSLNPEITVKVIVRGEPVLNDATMEDAEQVGLLNMTEVFGNGSTIAGTCLDRISEEARAELESADLILAKGQGNFETLRFCGMNIYYLFMCKCMMFAERFGVPQYSPMLLNDLRM